MNHLQPAPMFFFRRSLSFSDDVEMLQTDVMRFFAILCLCLMAIFALVKALPMAPPADRPTIAEPANLKAEAESLQKQIAALKAKVAETQTLLQKATAAAEQSSTQATQAEKAGKAALARVVKARQELKKVSQSLSETRHEIKMREEKLAKIMKDIADKRRIRAELKTEIKNETQSLTKIQAALDQAKDKLAGSLHQNQAPRAKPPEETPPPKPAKKGFSLRFASDTALETLIARGQVDFFAIAANKAWQLKLSAGRPVYISAKFPREIYEMETPTVPIAFASAFHRQVAAFGRGTVTWGVILPARTISAINQLIKGREGGDLVIMADGEVSLN
ncbi:MAG: hypothetical protein JSV31_12090 [Desulfobacterales bacterium]|nr:MAG: hypothetical protein JSV31_12090 [Desulfobacterales bacterium]